MNNEYTEVEMVAVVRCENCIHLLDHSLSPFEKQRLPRDKWHCGADNYPEYKSMPEGWYCAGGERRRL